MKRRSRLWPIPLLVLFSAAACAQPLRVCLGDSGHPVASGVVWVMANSWNGFDQVRAGIIRDGSLRLTGWSGMPAQWSKWPEEFRLLIGTSMQHVEEPAAARMSTPYQPDNYRSYPFWYSTRLLRPDELTADLAQPLGEAGDLRGGVLVLPRYRKRDLVLGYPFGQPLIGAKVPVYLFGWDRNHCAHHFGLPLGQYVTDRRGHVRFEAPPERLYLDMSFYHQVEDPRLKPAYEMSEGVQVPAYDKVEIGMLWRIPQHDYAVRIPADAVEQRAVLVGCPRVPCGGCETIADTADSGGWMRFHSVDLRLYTEILVQYRNGRQRPLDDDEFRHLAEEHAVDISAPSRPGVNP